jgi:hypothetical protein
MQMHLPLISYSLAPFNYRHGQCTGTSRNRATVAYKADVRGCRRIVPRLGKKFYGPEGIFKSVSKLVANGKVVG